MPTYLLTWNPHKWPWPKRRLRNAIKRIAAQGFANDRWSTGNPKRIHSGDRVFLVRQHVEPTGIVASGKATSDCFEAPHWDLSRSGPANYIDVRWDHLIEAELGPVEPLSLRPSIPGFPRALLASGILAG
jgi:hypothetical protein